MSDQKKIFIILSRVPYPLEKGDKLRAYHQIRALSKDHYISLCCLSDRRTDKETLTELNKITDELDILYLNRWLIYWNVFKMLFSTKPFQIGYFFQKKYKKIIHRKIEELQPDVIYCQLIRVAEYVKDIHNIPKTIDYMDAFSKGMLRRAKIEKGIRKYLLKLEGERLRIYENRIFDYFDHHTIISEQDRYYIGHTNNHSIKVVENGIDASFFENLEQPEKQYDIVFVGNLNYAPNISCCEFLIDKLYPELVKVKPDFKILLAGANPHDSIRSKVSSNTNIELSGWVEDIRFSYLSGKVFVAPLFIGTGLQNKLLEAMALGVPCVTTPLANNALGAQEGTEVLIAKTLQEFTDSVFLLLNDSGLYDNIGASARHFVKEHFDWKKSTGRIPL